MAEMMEPIKSFIYQMSRSRPESEGYTEGGQSEDGLFRPNISIDHGFKVPVRRKGTTGRVTNHPSTGQQSFEADHLKETMEERSRSNQERLASAK